MQLGLNSEIFNAILYNVKNLISIYKMYVALKLDDNGCCRIHSISDDGNGWIVTDKAVDGIFSHQGSEAEESERRERESEKKLRVSIKNTMRPI